MVYGLEDIMDMTWNEPWAEVWSAGHGPSRSYCGIARTEEGFAVDVFHGDTCVASVTFDSQAEAQQAANRMRGRYLRTPAQPRFEAPSPTQSATAH
jgi:hypothetical protein